MGHQKLEWDKMTNEEVLQLFKEQYNTIRPYGSEEYMKKCNTPSLYILKKKIRINLE